MREVDLVVCGAGPVGAACVLFLRERGIAASRIALVDARTREAAAADDRLIAISHGSATLLSRLGAWPDVEPRATAIETIHVSHRGRFGRTVIDRDDYGVAALGYVIRHGDLTQALDAALTRHGVEVRRPLRVTSIEPEGDDLQVTMTDEQGVPSTLVARHAVHAEGGLFDRQQRRAVHRDYEQTAITSFVTLATPSEAAAHTAFERFTDAGPIALLPARRARADGRVGDARVGGYALVWCGRPADAAARMALSDDAFLQALHVAFGDRLGAFASVAPRFAYPLGLNAVAQPATLRSATSAEFAIGNAAQTLHPVAGQGLNLGLRDAHALASLLAEGDRDERLDAAASVARFVAARRADRAATVNLTDAMPRVFASELSPLTLGRGLALALLDASTPLRNVFARQMMNGRR